MRQEARSPLLLFLIIYELLSKLTINIDGIEEHIIFIFSNKTVPI